MTAQDIRSRSSEELVGELRNLRESVFNAKFRRSLGQVEDTSQFKKAKRDLARIQTVLRLRQLGIEKSE